MARVRLIEQPKYEFEHRTKVQARDVNYAGHLGNDALVSIIGNARAELFYSFGFSETDLGDGETGIIITDIVINYKAEAFMFDELSVETQIGDITNKGFRLYHRVKKDGNLIAVAETGQRFFSYKKREVVPIPETFLGWLKKRRLSGNIENVEDIGQ